MTQTASSLQRSWCDSPVPLVLLASLSHPQNPRKPAHLPRSGCHLSPPKMHGAALTLFPGLWPLKGPVGDVLCRMGTTVNQRAYPFHHVDQITKVCRASLSDLHPEDGAPASQVLSPVVAAGVGQAAPC